MTETGMVTFTRARSMVGPRKTKPQMAEGKKDEEILAEKEVF
jgi:hypothetical protein